MKILLISANREQSHMLVFPLGLNCVAEAVRQAGYDLKVLDLMVEPNPLDAVKTILTEFGPDVIGISIRNIDNQSPDTPRFFLDDTRQLVTICREYSSATIVLGGAGYSIYPSAALDYCGADMGIQGAGEKPFLELLNVLEHDDNVEKIPGLYLPNRGLQTERKTYKTLDDVPVPGYDSWAHLPDKSEIWLPFQTRRGCPMCCNYCSTASIEGTRITKRSPEKAVEGLVNGMNEGFDKFYFTDNTFNLPQSYAKSLCREIIRRGLPITWRCILYPLNVDEELARLMWEAGCREVSLGCESGSPKILKIMKKRFSPEDVLRINMLIAQYEIRQNGFLLLGGPGETRETVQESLDFVDKLHLSMLHITIGIRIYGGTELAHQAVAEGLFPPDETFLEPRFYLVPELAEWLPQKMREWTDARREKWDIVM